MTDNWYEDANPYESVWDSVDGNKIVETNKIVDTKPITTNSWFTNKNPVNKNAKITLIGDSVLDNRAYTRTGKSTVDYVRDSIEGGQQGKKKMVNDQSVDGFTIYDCIENVHKVNDKSNAVVISAGGNDLLASMDLLGISDDTNITMALMNQELDKYMLAYETLIQNLKQSGRKFLLVTTYEGNLAYNPSRFDGVDHTAVSIVSMWNDRLYRIANDQNNRSNSIGMDFDVLDTRRFMSTNCYFNEIEPNDVGAKRIAKHINKWIWRKGVL